jgi:hypothetical protein
MNIPVPRSNTFVELIGHDRFLFILYNNRQLFPVSFEAQLTLHITQRALENVRYSTE